jgi:hypothetical protein
MITASPVRPFATDMPRATPSKAGMTTSRQGNLRSLVTLKAFPLGALTRTLAWREAESRNPRCRVYQPARRSDAIRRGKSGASGVLNAKAP